MVHTIWTVATQFVILVKDIIGDVTTPKETFKNNLQREWNYVKIPVISYMTCI